VFNGEDRLLISILNDREKENITDYVVSRWRPEPARLAFSWLFNDAVSIETICHEWWIGLGNSSSCPHTQDILEGKQCITKIHILDSYWSNRRCGSISIISILSTTHVERKGYLKIKNIWHEFLLGGNHYGFSGQKNQNPPLSWYSMNILCDTNLMSGVGQLSRITAGALACLYETYFRPKTKSCETCIHNFD
jgi:hypothetical protein